MPPNTVSVSRPGRWANRYRIGDEDPNPLRPERQMDAARVVSLYRTWIETAIKNDPSVLERIREELAGKDLACWCAPGAPCHADVLLDIAN